MSDWSDDEDTPVRHAPKPNNINNNVVSNGNGDDWGDGERGGFRAQHGGRGGPLGGFGPRGGFGGQRGFDGGRGGGYGGRGGGHGGRGGGHGGRGDGGDGGGGFRGGSRGGGQRGRFNDGSNGFEGGQRRYNENRRGFENGRRDFEEGQRRFGSDSSRFDYGSNGFNNGTNGHNDNSRDSNGGQRGSDDRRGPRSHDNSEFSNEKPAPPPRYEPEDVDESALLKDLHIDVGSHFKEYSQTRVQVTGDDVPEKVSAFDKMGLREIFMENLKRMRYEEPTPVQSHAVPIILAKRDLMACAQTGSGKTAAFMMPIMHKILDDGDQEIMAGLPVKPVALIVSPTRELTKQIESDGRLLAMNTILGIRAVYGGVSVFYEKRLLAQKPLHVLVATPGRLMDYIEREVVSLKNIKYLVLDEADRMLDQGFIEPLKQLVYHRDMPKDRQTLMFSATFPRRVQELASDFLKSGYLFLTCGTVGGACANVKQIIVEAKGFPEKRCKLISILQDMRATQGDNMQALVFVEQKKQVDFLATRLSEENIEATCMHGDRYQHQREEALRTFQSGQYKVLIATSVAARGLNIRGVSHVINYDLPSNRDDYVHRIGRTGRIGNEGLATAFFDESVDFRIAADLVDVLTDAQQEVPAFLQRVAEANPVGDGNRNFGRTHFGGRDFRQNGNGSRFNNNNGFNNGNNNNGTNNSVQDDDDEWD